MCIRDSIFPVFSNPLEQAVIYFESAETGTKGISIFNILGDKIYSVSTFEKIIDLKLLGKVVHFFELNQGKKRGVKRLVVPQVHFFVIVL